MTSGAGSARVDPLDGANRRRPHRPRGPVAHGAAPADELRSRRGCSRWRYAGTPDAAASSIPRLGAAGLLGHPGCRAAQDLLTPVLLDHSRPRVCVGTAIAALHGRHLRSRAASTSRRCSTTPGSRARCRTSTSRSVTRAGAQFTERHGVHAGGRELVADADPDPPHAGVGPGRRGACPSPPAQASTSSGCAATRSPTPSGGASCGTSRRRGSSAGSPPRGAPRRTGPRGRA